MNELKTIITDESNFADRVDEIDTVKHMKDARETISELKALIRKNHMTSLSAPAIGKSQRIFCINFSDSEIKTFINPIIVKAEGLVLSDEKSPILPNRRFLVPRNNKVAVMYTRPTGQIESREITGVAAAVFQQELQVLDGILLSDIGLEIDSLWDEASQEEKEEVINAYLDSLDIKEKEITKEIQSDPELKKIDDAIDFMTKLETGEVKGYDPNEDISREKKSKSKKKK